MTPRHNECCPLHMVVIGSVGCKRLAFTGALKDFEAMAAGTSQTSKLRGPKLSGPKLNGRRVTLIVAAILLTGALVSYSAALRQAPTFDEPLHAAAGYLIRFMNDYRVDIEDPALFPLLSS